MHRRPNTSRALPAAAILFLFPPLPLALALAATPSSADPAPTAAPAAAPSAHHAADAPHTRPIVVEGVVELHESPLAPTRVRPEHNAALRWWRAWADHDHQQARRIANALDNPDLPTDSLRSLLKHHVHALHLARRAADLPDCDFGVDYSLGIHADLPHLAPLRTSAQLLILSARYHAELGHHELAARDLARALNAAAHARTDRLLVSSLVATALAAAAAQEALRLHQQDLLTPAHRDHLADALRRFPRRDPFGVHAAIETEGLLHARWAELLLTADPDEPDHADRLRLRVAELGDPGLPTIDADRYLGPDGRDRLDRDLDAFRAYSRLAADAWAAAATDGDRAPLDRLESALSTNEFGPITELLAPGLAIVHKNHTRAVQKLDRLRDALRP